MYLKSLEVHGFKSFANKIKFDFHNGITGIVGPNGSGKSNVADAVRWVLGEQRARQLRGANMQDVIFSGTENRKPLSYAAVSLTLDNSDHQLPIEFGEVTITRRVYRSGESEYLLNGTACRLKDVNELFYDTGIGKEGYSIIGQGQIDRILNGRPEERRELFDEAAGIVKYKRRKAAAQKKLESEQANLVRVNDILGEQEKQLLPLLKQSESAKIYIQKKEELKEYEVNLFLMEIDRMETQLEQVSENLKIAGRQLEDTNGAVAAIKDEYEKMEQEMEETEEKINNTREQLSEINLTREKLEGQIQVLNEQIKASNNNDEHYRMRLETMKEECLVKAEQEHHYCEEQEEFSRQLMEKQDALKQRRTELCESQSQIQHYKQEIETGKNEIIDLLNSKASIKAKLQKFDTMMEQVNIRKAQLNQRLVQKKSDEEQMNGVLEDYLQKQSITQQQLLEKNQKLIHMQEKTASWNLKLKETRAALDTKTVEFHKEESKLESLRNITERYDGYGNGIRRVMEKKAEDPGLVGVVADIIKTEKKFELAIETALGGSIQNIVTRDEDTAKNFIAYLKENHFGRATFLPLTSVHAKEDSKIEKAQKEPGVLGRGDQLVEKSQEFQGVISYLLGRVLVVDTIEHGLLLAKKYQYSLRIVTLYGEALNPGGSLTGGSFKNASSLLGRKREIQELEKNILNIKQEQEQLASRLEEIRTAAELLDEDKGKQKEEIQGLQLEENTIRMNVESIQKKKQENDSLYEGLKKEFQEIEEQLIENETSKKQILCDLEASKKREKDIESEITQLEEFAKKKIVMEEAQEEKISSLLLEEAAIRQKQEFSFENRARIQSEICKLKEEEEALEKNTLHTKEEIENRNITIREIQQTIQNEREDSIEYKKKLELLQKQKEEITVSHKSFFQKREELTKRQSALDKEIFRLNSQKEKLDVEMETQNNYIWEEYQLTRHPAMELKREDIHNSTELRRQILLIREDIRGLGTVNVNAIEDYKSLSERYQFLFEQREDLVRAEETLLSIIQELDVGMRKQFIEKFKEIQIEFDRAFKELFGGGKGTLELSEGEDLLECGIIIVAQPPGKKLQNMMQLSGGEKALTAISLLFAIQNMKPSPFCLLDEIEAALDDSNVGRFANYLSKLTKNTQFIIITHRRGTMTAADRLYGITMQEKGVSALVSVNLIEDELDK
ncbi:MAG: chromosome segregation protein SMC [Lachnospiraceae bacterium]